jgi:RND family efflux transporter MFP subunit
MFWLAAASCQARPSVTPTGTTVIAQPAIRTDSTRELRLSGTFAAERSTPVSFAVPGTVTEVLAREGQLVKRGQVLARLSPRAYEDAVGIAQAKADQAEDAHRRLEPMFRNQTLPEVKMVEVNTGWREARHSLSMARKNLEDTVLRAPETGVVSRRHLEPGANVMPGIPVVTLVQIANLHAKAPVPELMVARLKVGDQARVAVPALAKTLDGVIKEIAVVADPFTRTYDVKVVVPNPAGDLRIGMVAQVRLRLPGQKDAVVVPPEAVRVDEEGAPSAFVVGPEHKLVRRHLELAGFVGEGTAVAKGLVEGELVVTSGTPMLAEGMVVRVADGRIAEATK